MTTPTASTSEHDPGWADELATYVGPGCFPATHDHLAATLIQRHAPSHLLWHLSVLSRTREFQSLDELVEVLTHTAPPAGPGAVGDHY
ncbi:DUF2795 domain-containing protein [Pedococcus sp. P5_B7]